MSKSHLLKHNRWVSQIISKAPTNAAAHVSYNDLYTGELVYCTYPVHGWTGSRCTVHVLKSARTTRFCVRFRVFHRRVDRPSTTLVYCKNTPGACFRINSSSYQSSCSSVTKQSCSLTSIGKSAFTQALIISSLHNRK